MSSNAVFAFSLTLGAGLATSIGALVPFFVKTTNKVMLACSLGFAAGVMFYVSFIEIFYKSKTAFEAFIGPRHAPLATMGCFFGGVLFAAFLDFLVHLIDPGLHHHHHHENHEQEHSHDHGHGHSPGILEIEDVPTSSTNTYPLQVLSDANEESKDVAADPQNPEDPSPVESPEDLVARLHQVTTVRFLQKPLTWIREDWDGFKDTTADAKKLRTMGLVTALAIAIHNFPEGLATFVAALASPGIGISLAVAIAIHNIPEGISVAMPIYFSTGSRIKAFLWASISGLSEPVGAGLGWVIVAAADNQAMFGVMFGLVAGMMVFISIKELIPTAHSNDTHDRYTTWSFIFGMAIMGASLLLFHYGSNST